MNIAFSSPRPPPSNVCFQIRRECWWWWWCFYLSFSFVVVLFSDDLIEKKINDELGTHRKMSFLQLERFAPNLIQHFRIPADEKTRFESRERERKLWEEIQLFSVVDCQFLCDCLLNTLLLMILKTKQSSPKIELIMTKTIRSDRISCDQKINNNKSVDILFLDSFNLRVQFTFICNMLLGIWKIALGLKLRCELSLMHYTELFSAFKVSSVDLVALSLLSPVELCSLIIICVSNV